MSEFTARANGRDEAYSAVAYAVECWRSKPPKERRNFFNEQHKEARSYSEMLVRQAEECDGTEEEIDLLYARSQAHLARAEVYRQLALI